MRAFLLAIVLVAVMLPASGQSVTHTPGLSIHCPDALDTEPNLTVTVRLPFDHIPRVTFNFIAANLYSDKGELYTGVDLYDDRGRGEWVSPRVFRLDFDIRPLKAGLYTVTMAGTVSGSSIAGRATCFIVKELRQTPIASLKLSKFTTSSFLLGHTGGDCLALFRLDVEVDGAKQAVSSGLSSPSLCSGESTSVELESPSIRKDSAVRIVYRPTGGEISKATTSTVSGLPETRYVCPDGSVADLPERCPRVSQSSMSPFPTRAAPKATELCYNVTVGNRTTTICGNETGATVKGAVPSPGFEAILAVAALGVALALRRRAWNL